jgi:hypothetical protein
MDFSHNGLIENDKEGKREIKIVGKIKIYLSCHARRSVFWSSHDLFKIIRQAACDKNAAAHRAPGGRPATSTALRSSPPRRKGAALINHAHLTDRVRLRIEAHVEIGLRPRFATLNSNLLTGSPLRLPALPEQPEHVEKGGKG